MVGEVDDGNELRAAVGAERRKPDHVQELLPLKSGRVDLTFLLPTLPHHKQ
jgi:hypothetical protein